MDQEISSDMIQRCFSDILNDISSEDSQSYSSTQNMNTSEHNTITAESCKNPVKSDNDLIMDFDRANAEFLDGLKQYAMKKKDFVKFGNIRDPMKTNDKSEHIEIPYGTLYNNPFAKNSKDRYSLVPYYDDDDSDASSDSRTSENEMSCYVKDIVIYVTQKTYLLYSPRRVRGRLNHLLDISERVSLAKQLMDAARTLLDLLKERSDYVEIILNIIVNLCNNDDKAIQSIGNDVKFTKMILSHSKSLDDMVLLNLLKLLKLAVSEIQKDHSSPWLDHLKKCDSFGLCISVILKFSFNDTLVMTAIELLKDIAKISLPDQSNFLKQLFNIPDLIPVLMTCCSQRIMSKKAKYSPTDLQFLYNWLSILMTIETNLIITFEESERKDKRILLKILFNILYPYQQTDVLSPEREIKEIQQHVNVIFKSISLLSSCLYRRLFIPLIMDRILMNIMLNIETVLPFRNKLIHSDSKWTSSEMLLFKFIRYMDEIWLSFMERRSTPLIIKLIKPLDYDGQEYFLSLGYYNPRIHYKIKEIHDEMLKDHLKHLFGY